MVNRRLLRRIKKELDATYKKLDTGIAGNDEGAQLDALWEMCRCAYILHNETNTEYNKLEYKLTGN